MELQHTETMANPVLLGDNEYMDAFQTRDHIIAKTAETERGPLYAANANRLIINCKNSGSAELNSAVDYVKKHIDSTLTNLIYRECPYTLAQLRQIQKEIQNSGVVQKDELVIVMPEWGRVEVYLTKDASRLESYIKQKQYGNAVTVFREINLR